MIIDFRVGAPLQVERSGNRPPPKTLYGEAYGRISAPQQEGMPANAAEFLETLDREGIDKVVVPVEDNETSLGTRTSPETLAAFCAEDPSRLIGFAGADPYKGMAAVREFEHAITDLGLRGLNIGQF